MKKDIIRLLVILLAISILVTGCRGSQETDEESSIKKDSGSNGKTYDNVNIVTSDGLSLKGRLFGFGKNGVVLSHMFPSDQTSWDDFASKLTEKGYIVLTFDFRGYGDSGGGKDPARIDIDELAALEFMKDQGTKKVFLIGASMGGTAALKTAAAEAVSGVISISAPRVFKGLSVEKNIANVKSPKLFIAGADDKEAVMEAEWLFDNTPEPKELKIFSGSDHGSDLLSGSDGEKVRKSIIDFLDDNSAN